MKLARQFAKKYLSTPHGILSYGGKSSLDRSGIVWKLHRWARKFSLAQSEQFSAEEWQHLQMNKLRHILRYAAGTVSHWQDMFETVGFDPEHLGNPSEFRKIPVSTRAALKDIPLDRLRARDMPSYRKIEASTSGSTGEPFSLYSDAYDAESRVIEMPYEYSFAGATLEKPLLILGYGKLVWLNEWGTRFLNNTLQNETLRKAVLYPFLRSKKPSCVRGTPSLLRLLGEAMMRDHEPYAFRYIAFGSESLDDSARLDIERMLGGRVFGAYGTRECSRIAIECEHKVLHICQWKNIVEILDDSGDPVRPGTDGRVVLTNLDNEVMPFIRYEIGDRGRISYGACACGRSIPSISISGRMRGTIALPSGKKVAVLSINTLLARTCNQSIQRFQIEDRPAELIVRFVPTDRWSEDAERELRRRMSRLLYGEKQITLEKVNAIVPNSAGKTPLFLTSS